jgi:sugar/nucleoside kinase (ribokinase family)
LDTAADAAPRASSTDDGGSSSANALLVVGSVGLDTVETPFGQVTDALGGSASYFSLAASLYSPVRVVGVVGEDFPKHFVDHLSSRRIDLTGLSTEPGRTFRWTGKYGYDLNTRDTLDTQLNVFADFHPRLPAAYRSSPFLFLGNIHPALQLDVLSQIERPVLTAMDTMNFWIEGDRAAVTEVIRRVDAVVMNEEEARQYAGTYSLVAAARFIRALGPKVVVIKKGEYGCVLFADSTYFVAPAYPLEEVKDPTGAGDAFAGGFMGYLARRGTIDIQCLRQAIIHGSVVASFTVEEFSVDRLLGLTWRELTERYREFRNFTYFDDGDTPRSFTTGEK